MRNTLLLSCLFVVLLLSGCQAEQPPASGVAKVEPATCGTVHNLHRIGDLYVAGKLSVDDYALLKDLGIKTVLNLRLDQETPDVDEATIVSGLGMTYIHVPWNGPEQLTDATFDAMRDALKKAERPLFFHCGSANRVGAGWLTYRVLDEGVDLDTALGEAKTIGLRSVEYENKAIQYIQARQSF